MTKEELLIFLSEHQVQETEETAHELFRMNNFLEEIPIDKLGIAKDGDFIHLFQKPKKEYLN